VWASATPGLDEAAADAFGEDVYSPAEWPQGGEVQLDGAVYRPVILTARDARSSGSGTLVPGLECDAGPRRQARGRQRTSGRLVRLTTAPACPRACVVS
jgi:hypothetical protein